MKAVRLRDQAGSDIEAAVDFYQEEAGIHVASKFIDAVGEQLVRIGEFPALGGTQFAEVLRLPTLRVWRIPGFPYALFYIEGVSQVDVLRVLHTRRDIPTSFGA